VDVQVAKNAPCQAAVTLKVSADEFEAQFSQGLQAAGSQLRLKGFRAGKVPAHVVRAKFGKEVRRETVQHFLSQAYSQAVEQESLDPALHPRIDPEAIEVGEGQDFDFSFEIALKPEFELGQTNGLEATLAQVELEDDEVERTIQNVRRQQARPEPADENGIGEEGMVLARMDLFHGEEQVGSRDGLRLTPGQCPPGLDEEAFKAELSKAVEGTEFDVPATFPDDFPKEEVRGKQGHARIAVSQAFKLILPEESELYVQFEVDGAEALRETVAERVLEAKRGQERARVENELFEGLIDAHEMELPAPMLDSQVEARQAQARQQMIQSGVPPEEIEAELEREDAATREAAAKSLRAFFLVERVAERENLSVGQQDMFNELRQIAMRNRASFDEVRKYYDEQGLMQQLAVELLERKVRAYLFEKSTAGAAASDAEAAAE
jgi:trigger factor